MTDRPMPPDINGTPVRPMASIGAALTARIPENCARRIHHFLAQNVSGNIRLNIRDGLVKGVRLEEVVSE